MSARHRVWFPILGVLLLGSSRPSGASNCLGTSTGNVPLNDLGTGGYLGQFQGGLYPGGSNALPAAHLAAGLDAAGRIVPRMTSGTADPDHGKVVLLSIGMSNTTAEFCVPGSGTTGCTPQSFMGQAAVDPRVNHATLAIVNGARGGQDASTWVDPSAANYGAVASLLAAQGLSEAQVEAVWVKEADAGPTVSLPSASADAYTLEARLAAIARAVKTRYPNVEQVFFSSRIYAGYASTTLNPEPYAYESAYAVKWLVQAQIAQLATSGHPPDPVAGDLDYTTVAPWIAWGPYLWADGTTPRSDGLTWVCGDFASDGTHPVTSAIQKVGGLLLDFFLSAAVTQSWFVSSGTSATTTTTTTTPTSSTTTTLPGCPPPVVGCQPAAPQGARITLVRGATPARNKLAWNWTGGPTTAEDFGDPTSATSYALCVYDGSGVRLSLVIPAGGTCGTRPCWKSTASGFRFGDAAAAGGVHSATLVATAAGTGRIAVRGKGGSLPVPALPLTMPVRVQLRRSGASTCWQADYTGAPLRNDPQQFRAREN